MSAFIKANKARRLDPSVVVIDPKQWTPGEVVPLGAVVFALKPLTKFDRFVMFFGLPRWSSEFERWRVVDIHSDDYSIPLPPGWCTAKEILSGEPAS